MTSSCSRLFCLTTASHRLQTWLLDSLVVVLYEHLKMVLWIQAGVFGRNPTWADAAPSVEGWWTWLFLQDHSRCSIAAWGWSQTKTSVLMFYCFWLELNCALLWFFFFFFLTRGPTGTHYRPVVQFQRAQVSVEKSSWMLLSTLQKHTFQPDKSLTAAGVISVCQQMVESRDGMGLRTVFTSCLSLFMYMNLSLHHTEKCLQQHLSCWSVFFNLVGCNRYIQYSTLHTNIPLLFAYFFLSAGMSIRCVPTLLSICLFFLSFGDCICVCTQGSLR